jgi:hypothetical protein
MSFGRGAIQSARLKASDSWGAIELLMASVLDIAEQFDSR